MAEFIGSRISLISKSDIRYVGTLHEIDSVLSTVALESVTSHGTEGRKGNPSEEIAASESIYEYIVFRGSDVKDLRIEEPPVAKENKPPQVPNDPAILAGSRPPPRARPEAQPQNQTPNQTQGGPPPPQSQQGPPPPGPPFGQQHQYPPPFYPQPPTGWGRGLPPPGPGPNGFPPMPYGGAPPGWYPPPGQGFPQHPGPFPPYGYPPGPPGQFQQHGPPPNQNTTPKPAPIGPGAKQNPAESQKQGETKSAVKPAEMPAAAVEKVVTPPVESKPAEVVSPVEQPSSSQNTPVATKLAPTGPKGRIQPALPLKSPAAVKAPLQGNSGNVPLPPVQSNTNTTLRDATQAATAAVAAAMAKLPQPGQTNGSAVDNLTKKVNEMRTTDPIRTPRHPGAPGAGFNQTRGGRGGRGGARGPPPPKTEVPATDFDFEGANAKFNKQDLVKEVIAGSPLGEQAPSLSPEEAPATVYNKSTSFFDNISSEARDRAEATNGGGRPGGREWRGEEQKKNVETFGQGSVDNGYRGGFRGRGRGRGRGFRGRGYGGNGGLPRGGYRGGNDGQITDQ